jgi:hypothetical protein
MKQLIVGRRARAAAASLLVFGVLIGAPSGALADEGGVPFWLSGSFGSLAATPQEPGWTLPTIYYHTSLEAGGEVAAARQFTIGRFNRTVNIDLNADLSADANLVFVFPTYVFATPVLGGQLAVGLGAAVGHNRVSIDGTLTLSVGDFIFTRSGSISDQRWGYSDLYPQVSLRWNSGVHNVMVYGMGDIPVGTYDPDRLSNFGIGHGAIDGGMGYTYFDPNAGNEFSVVSGLTYNFENHHTDYQNGIDWHADWGASKFLSKQLFVGAVGYFYNQLTADKGAPVILGEFKSRISAIGPQIGYIFPMGQLQGLLHLKGYWEFDAANRPEGWNAWLTFVISPAAPHSASPAPTRPRISK